MNPQWKLLHPAANYEMLGHLPTFLDVNDPRPAQVQLDQNYAHGGGWHSFRRHKFNREKLTLMYPGDPPMQAIAETRLRNERIILFDCAWVMVLQEDGSYDVARMD